jgi:hypothetical protein
MTFFLFFYIFPTGKFAPRWTRWATAIWALIFFFSSFFPDSSLNINQWPTALAAVVVVPLFASLAVAQIERYRTVSDAIARLQTKWIVAVTIVGVATFLVSVSTVLVRASEERLFYRYWILTDLGFSLLTYLLPIAIGIAILRYRLWDIDIIIRKTVQYGVLTAVLGLVYYGSVLLLQGLFTRVTGQESAVALVLSTLLIAALFTPSRRRIQEFIDGRFFRKKYNAQQVLAQFAQTARDETDMDKLAVALVNIIETTIQPETVSVWLKPTAVTPSRVTPQPKSESDL